MMQRKGIFWLVPLLTLVVGCSKAEENRREASKTSADMSQHKPAMNHASSGDADTDFLQAMIPHHQGAIDLARDEIAKGSDPKVLALAQKVIQDQQAEITQMEKWLADRRSQRQETK
ncbi:DUF305 domain-containing protein [Sphingomonas sp. TX0543]|uniref:CopM family metallochaperone n=1 Tax=Sphingomonas sp. TX0543 TaxID=3399682 RepID=UPI003AFA9B7F